MNWSNKNCQDASAQETKRLDRTEKQLLEIGKAEQDLLVAWNIRRKSKLSKPSPVIKNVRVISDYSDSRKRARLEA